MTAEAPLENANANLDHRDVKPSNLIVTGLPDGRFQIKLVDLGLAKFTPRPAIRAIAQGASDYRSIRSMTPEQFGRQPVEKRTDTYAIDCFYYYGLTGPYPLEGESAKKVIASHLQYKATPPEICPNLPAWFCS
ncbi:MAG: hypothetical protein ABF379_13255 [Akkermansiaceae bacterium]|jgi:serine/threonine protein kinase